jgi:hypothetical protein
LLNIIAIAQQHDTRVAQEEFQIWKLQVRADRCATVLCDGGNATLFTRRRFRLQISRWTK